MTVKGRRDRVLIVGPYGGFNLGDDAIAFSLISHFKGLGIEVGITVCDPRSAVRLDADYLEEMSRLRSGKLGFLRRIQNYNSVIVGGGQQFQEPRIPNPLWGHLANVWQTAIIAEKLRKPLAIIGVGVNQKFSRLGKFLIRQILRRCQYISVRDAESQTVLLRYVPPQINIRLGADPVFGLTMHPSNECIQNNPGHKAKEVLWILSNDKIHDLSYLKVVRDAIDRLKLRGVNSKITFTDFQPSYDQVLRFHPELQFPQSEVWLQNPARSLQELLKHIQRSDCVVTSRMHGMILAAMLDVPVVALCRAPKMISIASQIGIPSYSAVELKILTCEWLTGAIDRTIFEKEKNAPIIRANIEALQNRVRSDLDKASEFLVDC